MVHVEGHQKGTSFEAIGNNFADKEAKEVGMMEEAELLYVTPVLEEIIPIFSEKEKEELTNIGKGNGNYRMDTKCLINP